jgi:hypothetical protein
MLFEFQIFYSDGYVSPVVNCHPAWSVLYNEAVFVEDLWLVNAMIALWNYVPPALTYLLNQWSRVLLEKLTGP